MIFFLPYRVAELTKINNTNILKVMMQPSVLTLVLHAGSSKLFVCCNECRHMYGQSNCFGLKEIVPVYPAY